jgi:stalled ribosome alternative rescue factor ArfA
MCSGNIHNYLIYFRVEEKKEVRGTGSYCRKKK